MTISRLRPLALAAFAFAVIGCDQGRTNPPDVTVRIVNAAPGFPDLQFAREQTEPTDVQFRSGFVAQPYDEDTYDFRVYVRDATNGGVKQKREFSKQIHAGTLYTFVLAQKGTDVQELILEATPPAANATDAQVAAAHAGEGLPAMDVFLERPGANIAGAVPWGSLSFLGTLAPRSVPIGDYEFTLTAAGNRSNVLFKSRVFSLGPTNSVAFVITPEAADTVAPVSVTVGDAVFESLSDVNALAAVRVINAAADRAPRDVAFNGQFSPPLFAAVPFAAPTPYIPIAPTAETSVNVTPPGNPGVLELDQKVSVTQTRKQTLMFFGDTGALTHIFTVDESRRLLDEASVVFYHAATQFTGLDLVAVPAGVDPTTAQQAMSLTPGLISTSISAAPGDYTVYLRQSGTTTLVAGPIPVTLASAGIFGFLATNGPDSVTATVTLIDDFQ